MELEDDIVIFICVNVDYLEFNAAQMIIDVPVSVATRDAGDFVPFDCPRSCCRYIVIESMHSRFSTSND